MSMSMLMLLRGGPGSGKTAVGSALAEGLAAWDFIELDEVKRGRHGVQVFDPGAFTEAGRRTRRVLQAGRSVIAEEFFNRLDLISTFLEPTGLVLDSPDLIAFWLDCDVEVAVQRKSGTLPGGVVRAAHTAVATRYIHPGEVVIDTTHATTDETVDRITRDLEVMGWK